MAHVTSGEGAPPGVPFVSANNIHKSFGGVRALDGVSLDVHAGEVHGLVGANGAGKSTLIRILAGLERPDAGVIALDGQPVAIETPHIATRHGLSFIHQELALVPRMSVVENIMLGAPKRTRFGMVDWLRVVGHVAPICRRVGVAFSLTAQNSSVY